GRPGAPPLRPTAPRRGGAPGARDRGRRSRPAGPGRGRGRGAAGPGWESPPRTVGRAARGGGAARARAPRLCARRGVAPRPPTRLAARRERRLGVELPLATIFAAPVLSALAARLEALAPEKRRMTRRMRPIRRVSRDRQLPLSFAQERLWFIDRLAPGRAQYN